MEAGNNNIKLGDYVVLRDISGPQKLICLSEESQIFHFGKYAIHCSDIIGKNYYNVLNFQEGEWRIGSILNVDDILNDVINDEIEENINSDDACLNELLEDETSDKRKKRKANPLLESVPEIDPDIAEDNNQAAPLGDGTTISIMRNEIISLKKTNDSDLIKSLVLLSDKFKVKTKYSKAKYIKKLQLRYLKQIILLPASILNITETFSCQNKSKIFNKFSPNSVGPRWGQCTVRIESIGNILTHGNISFDSEVLLYDNLSSGIVGGSIYRQLLEEGSLYDISMNYLTNDTIDGYFHGKLPTNFEAIIHNRNITKHKTNYFSIPISALDLFSREKERQYETNENDCVNINVNHEWLNCNIFDNIKFEISAEKLNLKKKRVFNRLSMLNKLYLNGVNTVVLVIDQIKWSNIKNSNKNKESSDKKTLGNCSNLPNSGKKDDANSYNNTSESELSEIKNLNDKYEREKYFNIENLIKITQEYLRPGGKLLIFTPFMTSELLKIHQDLTLSSRIDNSKYRPFIGIKLEETLIREHQVIDQRTHPAMDSNLPLFSGFLLSAILVL